MATNIECFPFEPDYVSAPGETLAEALEEHGMSQAELARRMGRPKKTINEIIQGKTEITPETALQLERVLGIPATFWLNNERAYREYLAKLVDQNTLQEWTHWLGEIPINDLMRFGWIERTRNKTQQVYLALCFFAVSSPEVWRELWQQEQVAFRRSDSIIPNLGATAAWLRRGEIEAQAIQCKKYDEAHFLTTLQYIRTLTLLPLEKLVAQLVEKCAAAGVAVTFVPELPHTGVYGATRWLTPQKALIQLSLRYKSDDHLWFTFFHEACHVLRHPKKAIFIENGQNGSGQEQEANRFAADFLIPEHDWRQFLAQHTHYSQEVIQSFASDLGISAGIVVGRLQHEGMIPHSYCNNLKTHYTWTSAE